MNKEETVRFSRQMKIKNWGEEGQSRLKNATVAVAGCGGLGSPVILYLAAAGVGSLILIDYDVLELSNMNRQVIHNTSSIGTPKVASASERALKVNPDIRIDPVQEKLTPRNCSSLLQGADIIVDCLDNFKARHVVNSFAVAEQVPLVHGGIEEFQGQASFIHSPETPCLACFLPTKDRPEKPQVVGATAGIIGSIQAQETVKYITGVGPALKNRLLFFDGQVMETETMNLTKNRSCKVCSGK